MFAVIRTGGKQYKVTAGSVLLVEKLSHEAGEKVHLKDVLMLSSEKSTELGSPVLDGVEVVAEVREQIKDKKVLIFKKKRRQNYRRKRGHRQLKTVLEIVDILKAGKSVIEGLPVKASKKAAEKPAEEKAKKAPAKKAAAPKAEASAEKKPAAKKTAEKKETKAAAPKKKVAAKKEEK